MKRLAGLLALGVALAAAPGVRAASCDLTGYVFSPDLTAYSVPGLGLAAFDGVPAGCDLAMPIQGVVGHDVISLFSASYSGELSEGTGAQLTVQHNGQTETTNLVGDPGGTFGELATGNVFARGNELQSRFDIAVTSPVGGDEFDLDSADYVLQSQTDLFDLSVARTGLVTHLSATTSLLGGAGQPFDDQDGVSLLGGIGSVTLGVRGVKTLGDGTSVFGGLAYVDQSTIGNSTAGAVVFGGARYVTPDQGQLYRPFLEAGASLAPSLSMTFSQTFTTPGGTVAASSVTGGSYLGGYVSGGVLVAPRAGDQVILAASLATDALNTGALSFSPSGTGMFEVDQPAQTGVFNVASVGGQWTHEFSPALALTLVGAVGRTTGMTDVTSTIAGAGSFSTSAASELFARYGARVSYSVTDASTVSAFAFGTNGQSSGGHAQIGAGLHMSF